jgi:hypothetical protein
MEISEIKQKLSILKVLSHYNLKPDRNNRLCCPFHNEKHQASRSTWKPVPGHALAATVQQVAVTRGFYNEEGRNHETPCYPEGPGVDGRTRRPQAGKTKPVQDMKPLPELTSEERTEILTEAFTHFARSLNVRPEKQ